MAVTNYARTVKTSGVYRRMWRFEKLSRQRIKPITITGPAAPDVNLLFFDPHRQGHEL